MRIAWDDDQNYWPGDMFELTDGSWHLASEVPLEPGRLVTITPITPAAGPHIEFRARVLDQSENVMVAAFSDRRFHSRLETVDLDGETARGLRRCLRVAA